MTNKKLGLLLLPLIPLSAIGVVSIVNGLIPAKQTPGNAIACPQAQAPLHFSEAPPPAPPPTPPQPPPAK